MADFSSTLRINGNQMRDAVLQRTTAANQVADITRNGQIGYSDTVNKILYFDGTTIQFVASESYVSSQITANLLTVAPSSANLLDITGNQISLKALAIQKVFTDTTSTTLALALAARTPVYNATNVGNGTADLQEGDVLILAVATGGQQVYIHNAGVAGTTADFTLMETPQVNNAAIRALLSGTNGLTYNSTTGEFKLGGTLSDAITTLEVGANEFRVRQGAGNASFRVLGTLVSMSHGSGLINLSQTDFNFTLGNFGNDGLASVTDNRPTKRGLQYSADYGASLTARSLIDKGNVEALIAAAAKKSTQTVTTVADTFLTVTHNFALANPKSIQVAVWKGNIKTEPDIEVVDANSIRIRTSQAEVGLEVFMIA